MENKCFYVNRNWSDIIPDDGSKGRAAFPLLWNEIYNATEEQNEKNAYFIEHGYMPTWAEHERKQSDNGLRRYSTDTRWTQYQAGKISREKAVELATRRAIRDNYKTRAARLDALERAETARELDYISVSVEWKRNSYWGNNPTATVWADIETTGRASGCGYDKESAAIAEAFNKNPAILRILYHQAEKALENGESGRSKTSCTGYNWAAAIGYGSGYSVLPYFEGGVGASSFWNIFQRAGYDARNTGSGKRYDHYTISR